MARAYYMPMLVKKTNSHSHLREGGEAKPPTRGHIFIDRDKSICGKIYIFKRGNQEILKETDLSKV